MKYVDRHKPSGLISAVLFDAADIVVSSFVVVAIIFTLFIRVVTVQGSSMKPNYIHGDKVLSTNGVFNLKLGDVVIITDVLEKGPIIKRVIATEGQTVDFDTETKSVIVDGKPVDDSVFGVKNGITEVMWENYDTLDFPQTVPKGHIFVLGDNRTLSNDSRFSEIGMVDNRKILGKAVIKLYPFEKIGLAK